MNRFMLKLELLDRIVEMALKTVSTCCFVLLFVLLAGNVFVRYFPFMSFHWFDEIVEWAFAWMVFYGAAALWREKEHFRIQWIEDILKKWRVGKLFKAILSLSSIVFFVILTYQGYQWFSKAMDWTAFFNIPRKVIYSCIPISGFIMLVYAIRDFLQELTKVFLVYDSQ